MRIGMVGKKAGVGVETIRFYERRGLIGQPPRPADGGYRSYSTDAVERIRFIRQAQELGFSLKEIDELLSLRADPATGCEDVRRRAVAKLEEVDRKLSRLGAIRIALEELISTCPRRGRAVQSCTILDALGSVPTGGPDLSPPSAG